MESSGYFSSPLSASGNVSFLGDDGLFANQYNFLGIVYTSLRKINGGKPLGKDVSEKWLWRSESRSLDEKSH